MVSDSVKWLQILLEVLEHAFSMVVIALLREQKLILGGGGEWGGTVFFKNYIYVSKTDIRAFRTSCIICTVLYKMKMRGVLFKKEKKRTMTDTKMYGFFFSSAV